MLILTGLVSCSATEREAGPASLSAPDVVTHVVMFELSDAGDVEALIADCDRWLAGIPSVIAYDVGRPLDIGRSTVSLDFDVGLIVAFADVDGYRAQQPVARAIPVVAAPAEPISALSDLDESTDSPAI